MKRQALFSSKDKSEKLKCRLLQLLFGALRVNLLLTLNLHVLNSKYNQLLQLCMARTTWSDFVIMSASVRLGI